MEQVSSNKNTFYDLINKQKAIYDNQESLIAELNKKIHILQTEVHRLQTTDKNVSNPSGVNVSNNQLPGKIKISHFIINEQLYEKPRVVNLQQDNYYAFTSKFIISILGNIALEDYPKFTLNMLRNMNVRFYRIEGFDLPPGVIIRPKQSSNNNKRQKCENNNVNNSTSYQDDELEEVD